MPKYGINKAVLVGNVSTEPELRYTQQGHAVCSFRLATTERRPSADGSYRDVTDWHNITLWRKKAELAKNYLRVGSGVYLEGRIVTRSWEDKEGQKRYTTEIEVDKMRMLDPAPANTTSAAAPAAPSPSAKPVSPPAGESSSTSSETQENDDLPF